MMGDWEMVARGGLEKLQQENQKLKDELSHLRKAGACNACEAVGEENQELQAKIEQQEKRIAELREIVADFQDRLHEFDIQQIKEQKDK